MGLDQADGQGGEGFSNLGTVEGTTGEPPEGTGEQPNSGTQTTSGSESSGSEETFFDPSTLTDELQPAYKQMQAAFTKKMQGIKDSQQKIEAYNAFQTNPYGMLQQLASQYGFSLVNGSKPDGETWEPQSWDDVMAKAEERAMAKLMPEIKSVRQKEMERTLDSISPDWRVYEDKMMDNLTKHPSLVSDPEALYRMSVPREVQESRAMQAALRKLEEKGTNSQLSGGSKTSRTSSTGDVQVKSFEDAVKVAQARLAEQGLHP